MQLMSLDEFLRLFPIRTTSLAWFLGAGASASARLPTAGDLIWRFKRTLYCTSAKVDPRTCDDLGNEVVRARLQRYLDGTGKYPAPNSPEEYASYFELTYPDPADRRRFIETMLHGATPAFGHHILAALMKASKVRLVWTTNFDRLVEDASAIAFGSTSALTVSTIDSSSVAIRALNDGSWPLLGKLHGDFQSVALKNTSEELRTQESALRAALIESCKRFGLIVAGYSGRDESVMNALEEAMSQDEVEGCFDAFDSIAGVDLYQIKQEVPWHGILYESASSPAMYPCERGIFLPLDEREILLWTQGDVPQASSRKHFYKEGKGIPHPIALRRFAGHGTWDGPVQSILGLTKMNWNNDQLYDRMPITLQYASKLAATMKSMPIVSSRPYELRLFI